LQINENTISCFEKIQKQNKIEKKQGEKNYKQISKIKKLEKKISNYTRENSLSHTRTHT